MLAREIDDVDVRDVAGNTPLMYTVMGRQPKVCKASCMWSIPNKYEYKMCLIKNMANAYTQKISLFSAHSTS